MCPTNSLKVTTWLKAKLAREKNTAETMDKSMMSKSRSSSNPSCLPSRHTTKAINKKPNKRKIPKV